MSTSDYSNRSRAVALLLGLPLGFFGAHRFYVGKHGTGTLMALTLGGLGIWWAVDVILITAGSFRDRDGRRVKYWTEDEAEYHMLEEGGQPGQVPQSVLDEIDNLRADVTELSERLDFTERLLTQRRHAGHLDAGD